MEIRLQSTSRTEVPSANRCGWLKIHTSFREISADWNKQQRPLFTAGFSPNPRAAPSPTQTAPLHYQASLNCSTTTGLSQAPHNNTVLQLSYFKTTRGAGQQSRENVQVARDVISHFTDANLPIRPHNEHNCFLNPLSYLFQALGRRLILSETVNVSFQTELKNRAAFPHGHETGRGWKLAHDRVFSGQFTKTYIKLI